MALEYCRNCKRKLSPGRKACAKCGALIPESERETGSSHRLRNALVFVFVLVAVNVYLVMTRETGPPPELEALHSSEDAIRHCREGIEGRLSGSSGTVQGSLEAEYLQGGEYTVRGAVTVMEGRSRVTRPVFCEAQFRPEGGWTIENVEVGS